MKIRELNIRNFGKLNDTTNVKIYWDTLGVADNYVGFTIKIRKPSGEAHST